MSCTRFRAATRWVSYKDRKPVAAALKKVYTAANEDAARAALDAFAASDLGQRYPRSVQVWYDAWERFVTFLSFPPAARKVIYTTNAIESLNSQLRKSSKNRRQFPNDTAAVKLWWLMICKIEDNWARKRQAVKKRATTPSRLVEGARVTGWKQAINQMIVAYPERFNKYTETNPSKHN